jgi:enamine deaminase RidA (YjgF/YER057c/UK114 family)
MVSPMSTKATAENRLSQLGITLPPPPTPFGAYVETVKIGNLLFLSGMLPVIGREPQYIGRVGGSLSATDGRKAAEIACLNALSAAREHLGSLDKITGVAKLGVYIATEGDFRDHAKLPMALPNSSSRSSAPRCSRRGSCLALPACRLACRSKSSWFSKSRPRPVRQLDAAKISGAQKALQVVELPWPRGLGAQCCDLLGE